MTDDERQATKQRLLDALIQQRGFKTVAATSIGLSPRTLRQWMRTDPDFSRDVDDIVEACRDMRDDTAEERLFRLVEDGDTAATIFYAKTRLKARGYTEKPLPTPDPAQAALTAAPDALPMPDGTRQRIEAKKAELVQLLRREGKYTPELEMQAGLTAQLLVRADMLAAEIFAPDHQAVTVEISREGNRRETISPRERLYADLIAQSQRALRALGMNTDSRTRPAQDDAFADFIAQFADPATAPDQP